MPGSDHGPSIKCPHIYEALRREGMTKEKAARISNAACKKQGMKSTEDSIDITPDEESEIWRLVGLVWNELYPDEELPDFAKVAAEPKCKKEGDAGCFEKGDYAYTPGDSPFTWKIRLTSKPGGDPDATTVGAAIAALGKGFRGNKADIPDEAKAGVMERVRQAWRKANPDKKDDDMPDAIKKASEFDEKRSPDYLAQMIAWFKEKFGTRFDEEEYRKAHRSAMGHAGGKATARKRRDEKVAAEDVYEHTIEHPEPVLSCEFCGDYYQSPMAPVIKMLKADERVNYRDAEDGGDTPIRCYNCRFYEWGACRLVEGSIEADDVCDLFMPPVKVVPDPTPSLYVAAETGSAWALFNELPQSFADAPETINVLPVPGVYDHKLYGKIVVTPERNARFVDNFKNQVYQKDIPITIDIEHDGKVSGAMGYFEELTLNDDGSVDATVRWNDTGRTMIEEDRFHYFSPEWMDSWRNPATGDEFDDVLIGGALTVRPFFKESALRPLVASELALYAPDGSGGEPTTIMLRPLVATEYVRESTNMGVELTEDEVKEFRELQANRTATEEQLKAANERIGTLEADRRRQRFTDIVRGRSEGSDGAAWVGDVQRNVESLERLAQVFGEDSDEFKAEVTFRSELATTSKASGIFKPLGSPEGGVTGDGPIEELDRRAKELIAAEPGLSRSDAVSRVFREDNDLYFRYNKATRVKEDE